MALLVVANFGDPFFDDRKLSAFVACKAALRQQTLALGKLRVERYDLARGLVGCCQQAFCLGYAALHVVTLAQSTDEPGQASFVGLDERIELAIGRFLLAERIAQ